MSPVSDAVAGQPGNLRARFAPVRPVWRHRQLRWASSGTGAIDLQRSRLIHGHGCPRRRRAGLLSARSRSRYRRRALQWSGCTHGVGTRDRLAITRRWKPAFRSACRTSSVLACSWLTTRSMSAFGSHGDQYPFHGWIFGYDASDLSRQVGVYMTARRTAMAVLSGNPDAVRLPTEGNIYAVTGNGDYDGMQNFGESFVKISADGSATLDCLHSCRLEIDVRTMTSTYPRTGTDCRHPYPDRRRQDR